MDNVPDYYHPGSQLSAKIVNHDGLVIDASYTVVDAFTPFTMSQVLVVQTNHKSQSPIILKVYDPRCFSHRFKGRIQHPWSYDAEKEAARQRAAPDEPFDFVFPLEIPEDDDKVGWEQWYYQYAEVFANNEVTAYRHLTPLQGQGIPECFGSGTLNLTGRAIAPHVLILEYLPHAQTLETIAANLITQPIIDSLIITASRFGPLGVTHSDPNTGNFLFVVGQDGALCRAVIIDFGSSYFREQESDEDWALIVRQQGDVRFLKLRLEAKLREMG